MITNAVCFHSPISRIWHIPQTSWHACHRSENKTSWRIIIAQTAPRRRRRHSSARHIRLPIPLETNKTPRKETRGRRARIHRHLRVPRHEEAGTADDRRTGIHTPCETVWFREDGEVHDLGVDMCPCAIEVVCVFEEGVSYRRGRDDVACFEEGCMWSVYFHADKWVFPGGIGVRLDQDANIGRFPRPSSRSSRILFLPDIRRGTRHLRAKGEIARRLCPDAEGQLYALADGPAH